MARTAAPAPTTAARAVGRDESWPLRSITKSFTVTLILQLADEGLLDLDDPVAAYVDGVPNGKRVTLRDLAAMTSGLPDYPTPAFGADLLADPTRIFRPDELLAYAWREPLQGPAGGAAVYTNSNTVLLGRVVEAVSGTSFAQALRQRILRPLGLEHTLATPDARRWPEPRPVGYELENGEPTPQLPNLSIYAAAGEMVARFGDLRRWARALGRGTLLRPATQADRLESAQPLERGPEYDRYGLGIGKLSGWWGHTGEGLGFTALVMQEPHSGARAVIAMNTTARPEGHPPTLLFRQVAELLERRGITGPQKAEQKGNQLPKDRLTGALERVMDDLAVPGAAAGVWVPGMGHWRRFAGEAVLAGDASGGDPITAPVGSRAKASSPWGPEPLAWTEMVVAPPPAAPLAELFPAAGPGFDPSGALPLG
jgi:D-alanyl-D-alanine carboxypeptidase